MPPGKSFHTKDKFRPKSFPQQESTYASVVSCLWHVLSRGMGGCRVGVYPGPGPGRGNRGGAGWDRAGRYPVLVLAGGWAGGRAAVLVPAGGGVGMGIGVPYPGPGWGTPSQWSDKQSENITLPRTSHVGSNNYQKTWRWIVLSHLNGQYFMSFLSRMVDWYITSWSSFTTIICM